MKIRQLRRKKVEMSGVDRFFKDRVKLFIIFLITLTCGGFVMPFITGSYGDQIILFVVLSFCAGLLLVLYMEKRALNTKTIEMYERNIKLPLITVIVSTIVVIALSLLSANVFGMLIVPFAFIVMINAAAFDTAFGVLVTLLYVCWETLLNAFSTYTLTAVILYVIAGAAVLKLFDKKETILKGALIMIAALFTISFGLVFMDGLSITSKDLISAMVNACVNTGLSLAVLPFIFTARSRFRTNSFADFLSSNHPVQKMMLSFSKVDYAHAQKVSILCGKCAEICGVQVDVCMMAGMYYRVGRMYGRPYVSNGVKIGMDYNFPPEVIEILAEYDGEYRAPSSVESALVNIVDCVVTKLEMVKTDKTFKSVWNKEMLIMNTLNERSQLGLYDKSGLSMNSFIKIRNYLVKEEI